MSRVIVMPVDENTELTLIDHLLELRRRVMWILAILLLCFAIMVPFAQKIYTFVAEPLMVNLPAGQHMIATEVIAPFFVPLKVTMMAAFLLTLPHTLYQVWAFIAPGLYRHEKRLILPLLIASVFLFALGMAFAYYLVFPVIFRFLTGITPVGVSMATDIDKYLSFILGMFVAFGVTFEVPVLVILLNRIGVVSVLQLKKARPYVVVGAFVVAAVVTPPDILSQTLLAIPLIFLYEIGILVCRCVGNDKKKSSLSYPVQRQ
ncbi:twin-arginine translocase subunit TatC [Snodgrassella alvi]|uniref:twin-arginine translocase subunit TatC n=1 Tax=Snodgrassella alvi TaxID=1196083 RepID=UPI0035128028